MIPAFIFHMSTACRDLPSFTDSIFTLTQTSQFSHSLVQRRLRLLIHLQRLKKSVKGAMNVSGSTKEAASFARSCKSYKIRFILLIKSSETLIAHRGPLTFGGLEIPSIFYFDVHM